MESDEDSGACTPPEVGDPAKTATIGLLPEKSKVLYEKEYSAFTKWCEDNKANTLSEDVLLAYFLDKSKEYKASSLWTYYSMLKVTLSVKQNVDIGKFSGLVAYLKSISVNHQPRKSEALTKSQIETFIREAPDDSYLMVKVALIMGVAGACRQGELTKLRIDDIDDLNSVLVVKLRDGKIKFSRTFTVINGNDDLVGIYRKYVALRPKDTDHKRLFVYYKNGKCSRQPVGKNTFGHIPGKVAKFLKLPDPSSYTGHCFRRSSAAFLAHSGGSVTKLRHRRAWRSSSAVQDCIGDSRSASLERNTNNVSDDQQNQSTSDASDPKISVKEELLDEDLDVSYASNYAPGDLVQAKFEERLEKTNEHQNNSADGTPFEEHSYSVEAASNGHADASRTIANDRNQTSEEASDSAAAEYNAFAQFVVQKLKNIKNNKKRVVLQQKICSLIFECELESYSD